MNCNNFIHLTKHLTSKPRILRVLYTSIQIHKFIHPIPPIYVYGMYKLSKHITGIHLKNTHHCLILILWTVYNV